MDIFGIGPLEMILILIVALVFLGPKDMAKAGRTIGRTLRKITTSETWQVIIRFTKEMQNMPNRLMREAQFDEVVNEVSEEIKKPLADIKAATAETNKSLSSLSAWTNPDLIAELEPGVEEDEITQRTIASPSNGDDQDVETP
jgi:sec-independent protein translocase protein TatB